MSAIGFMLTGVVVAATGLSAQPVKGWTFLVGLLILLFGYFIAEIGTELGVIQRLLKEARNSWPHQNSSDQSRPGD